MSTYAKLVAALALVAALLAGFFWQRAYYIGHGEALERARNDAKTVESLTELIHSHQGLIREANQASLDMQAAISDRQRADAESTRSFKNALSKTAALRAGCVFDADSLRFLDAARARAAEAATSGLRHAAPRTTGALRQ